MFHSFRAHQLLYKDYDTRLYYWLQQLGQLRLLALFEHKKFEDLQELTEEQLVKFGVLDSSTQNYILNSIDSIFGEVRTCVIVPCWYFFVISFPLLILTLKQDGVISPKYAPSVMRKGWLLLKGNSLRQGIGAGWTARFFILLSNGGLQYFLSEETSSPLGESHLSDLMDFRRTTLPGVDEEVLQLVTPHQTLSLRSDLPHDIDQWERQITAVIENLPPAKGVQVM